MDAEINLRLALVLGWQVWRRSLGHDPKSVLWLHDPAQGAPRHGGVYRYARATPAEALADHVAELSIPDFVADPSRVAHLVGARGFRLGVESVHSPDLQFAATFYRGDEPAGIATDPDLGRAVALAALRTLTRPSPGG